MDKHTHTHTMLTRGTSFFFRACGAPFRCDHTDRWCFIMVFYMVWPKCSSGMVQSSCHAWATRITCHLSRVKGARKSNRRSIGGVWAPIATRATRGGTNTVSRPGSESTRRPAGEGQGTPSSVPIVGWTGRRRHLAACIGGGHILTHNPEWSLIKQYISERSLFRKSQWFKVDDSPVFKSFISFRDTWY